MNRLGQCLRDIILTFFLAIEQKRAYRQFRLNGLKVLEHLSSTSEERGRIINSSNLNFGITLAFFKMHRGSCSCHSIVEMLD